VAQTWCSEGQRPESKYLSNSDSAYCFLEKLQKQAYESRPVRHRLSSKMEELYVLHFWSAEQHTLTSLGSPDVQKARSKYERELTSAVKQEERELRKLKLSTRYEDPVWYLRMSRIRDRIMATVSRLRMASPRIMFAGVPSRGVNALIVQVPDTKDILVLGKPAGALRFRNIYWPRPSLVAGRTSA
jgi:hypothetical protein